MNESELRATGLGVDLGDRAVLHDITLRAHAGESIAVAGPSGSGKTVLLLALAGILPAARGEVVLDGLAVTTADAELRSQFGIVLQAHGLASGLTAEENVALPLQARGLSGDDIADRCAEALSAVGLDDVGGRLVDSLSGGQQQRVGVARALAGRPRVFLADEPTAELDPPNRARVLSHLLDASAHRIVLIASNDPEIADACLHVAELRDGRIDAFR